MTKGLKRKMSIAVIVILVPFLMYALCLDKVIPTSNYIQMSKEIKLNDIEVSDSKYRRGVSFSLYYTKLYSKREGKYFITLYFTQTRTIGIPPRIPETLESITILVNEKDLSNPKYGSKENPIPVMNYKLEDDFAFDQKQYGYNIKIYKAYCWYVSFT